MGNDNARQSAATLRKGQMTFNLLWLVMAGLGAVFVAKHALPKLSITQAEYTDFYWDRRYWLFAHLCGGLLALLIGPLQFVARWRQRQPVLHRWIGRIYLVAIMFAAVTAGWLAWTSPVPQPLYVAGLYLVALLWLVTGWRGWSLIRRRAVLQHREWMIRNYAVTFFFVVFFGVYDAMMALGWPEDGWDMAATWGVWIGIILPLALAEAIIRSRRKG
jgi:uncharacterized membrane protein